MALVLLSEAALAGAQFETTSMRTNVAAVVAASPTSITNQAVKQIAKLVSDPRASIDWLLGAVAVILAALIIFALVLRPQVQPVHVLAPAMALLCLAVFLIVLNTTVLSSTGGQTAATIAAWQQSK